MGGGMRYNAKNSRRKATEAVGAVVKVRVSVRVRARIMIRRSGLEFGTRLYF